MGKRKTLKPSLRFEVFKRDKFTCQYCGRAAPDVLLHVDHIQPASKAGADDILNLITSCIDCNLGKGARLLTDDTALAKQRAQLAELQERREQLDMMVQWKSGLASIDEEAVAKVAEFYRQHFVGWVLNERGRGSLRQLITKHGVSDVLDSIVAAARQYVKIGEDGKATAESVDHAWSYVPRILTVKAAAKRDPGMDGLFYARGIARKRIPYFKDWEALSILKEAHKVGADADDLKDIARTCTSWSDWCCRMDELTERLKKEWF